MDKVEIRSVTRGPLESNLDIIHRSFQTVADDMGITTENAPRYTAFMPLERLEEERDNGGAFFGYFIGGQQVGFVTAEKEDGNWSMRRLAVLPEYRGRGIAGQLIRHVIDYIKSLGATCFHIGIVNEQKGLREWYEAMGFRVYEVFEVPDLPFTVAHLNMDLNEENGEA